MQTKEKLQDEGQQVRRPAGKKRPASGKRPAAKRPADVREGAGNARTRTAAAEPAQRKPRSAAPQEKRSAAPRSAAETRKPRTSGNLGRGKPIKPSGDEYKPYRKAANRRKTASRQSFARSVTRFFSYENPVMKLFRKQEPDVFGDGGSRSQQEAKAEARRRRRAMELNTPAVVYTQPASFNRSKLLIQLATILAVVLALVMGMSVFFRVKIITVSGANVYSAWTIREKSGISEGDNLLTFGRTRASGQIIANLPYVKSARIGIKLPDTVIIEVEEAPVVYAIRDEDAVWWLINSDGRIVEQTSASKAKNYTQVLGITLSGPQPGAQAVATEPIPTETEEDGSYVPLTVTGSAQLNAALNILQCLEDNDVVGSATSVDVTRLEDIVLWYGTQYQVNLGNTARMDYKIACMVDVILQMNDYQTGILDITFTTWKDQVGYTPFG